MTLPYIRTLPVVLCILTPLGCLRALRPEPDAPPPVPVAAEAPQGSLQAENAELRREIETQLAGMDGANVDRAALTTRIDELTALNAEIGDRLRTSAQSVELLAAERQRLLEELAVAQAKLAGIDRVEGASPSPARPAPTDAAPASAPAEAPPLPPPAPEGAPVDPRPIAEAPRDGT